MGEQFEKWRKNNARSQRKRTLLKNDCQGKKKRMKRDDTDQSSTIIRSSQIRLKIGDQEAINQDIPVGITTKLHVSPKSTEEELIGIFSMKKATPPEKRAVRSYIERSNEINASSESMKRTPGDGKRNIPSTRASSKPVTYSNAVKKYPRGVVRATVIARKANKTVRSKFQSSKLETLGRWWKTVLCLMSISMVIHAIYSKQPFEEECIYVNGGGFGGFWFILGQLYKLHKESEIKNYVCYSAGCLGAVSILANRTFEDLFDSALDIQTNWKSGSMSRFDAVEHFVDNLLGNSSQIDVSAFSNVHILTSAPKSGGWEVHQNIAGDMDHLKTLLVQTTWIPFLTGDHIWHPATGHMDGGFSRLQHPTCNIHVSLPWDWNLLVNTMNINMAKEEGNRYWELGLKYDF